jgi:hypothetical protein
VKLTTNLYFVLRLRINGTGSPLIHYAFVVCTETTLPLPVLLPLMVETFLNQNYYHYINVYYMLIKGILMGVQVLGYIKIILQAVEKGIMKRILENIILLYCTV